MMLDFSHGSGLTFNRIRPTAELGAEITGTIDAAIAAADGPERRYIGASQIGDPCARKLAYAAAGAPSAPAEGRMRRIWERGKWAEVRIISWLRQAGFSIRDRDADGNQLRFSQVGGRFSGGVDGILLDGPVPLPYPMLLEIKCLKSSSWNDLVKSGPRSYSDTYWAQIHVYMAYLQLSSCLYCAENADNMSLWWDLIPLDLPSAQHYSDRAVQLIRMIDNEELPPRVALSPDHWLCRMCPFSETICWRI